MRDALNAVRVVLLPANVCVGLWEAGLELVERTGEILLPQWLNPPVPDEEHEWM